MRLKIDGVEFFVERVDCEGDCGHILCFSTPWVGDNKGEIPEVFSRIKEVLQKTGVGLKSNEDQSSGHRGEYDKYAEIRLLRGLEIPVVLTMLMAGLSVIQID